jgi:hypothetical protein
MKRAPNQSTDPASPQDAASIALDGLQPAWQFSVTVPSDVTHDAPMTDVAANLDGQIVNDAFHFAASPEDSAVTITMEVSSSAAA